MSMQRAFTVHNAHFPDSQNGCLPVSLLSTSAKKNLHNNNMSLAIESLIKSTFPPLTGKALLTTATKCFFSASYQRQIWTRAGKIVENKTLVICRIRACTNLAGTDELGHQRPLSRRTENNLCPSHNDNFPLANKDCSWRLATTMRPTAPLRWHFAKRGCRSRLCSVLRNLLQARRHHRDHRPNSATQGKGQPPSPLHGHVQSCHN